MTDRSKISKKTFNISRISKYTSKFYRISVICVAGINSKYDETLRKHETTTTNNSKFTTFTSTKLINFYYRHSNII